MITLASVSICSILVLERRGGMIGHLLSPEGTSKGKSQPVQQQEGAGREGEAGYYSGCRAEKMLEYDENRRA
jgi:hypothetical protein